MSCALCALQVSNGSVTLSGSVEHVALPSAGQQQDMEANEQMARELMRRAREHEWRDAQERASAERRSALDRFAPVEEGGRDLTSPSEDLASRKALHYKASLHHSARFRGSFTKVQLPKTFRNR